MEVIWSLSGMRLNERVGFTNEVVLLQGETRGISMQWMELKFANLSLLSHPQSNVFPAKTTCNPKVISEVCGHICCVMEKCF